MNSANETLRAIRHRKALLTKERDESIAYINECYRKDMEILEKEEREWLEQFNDVPINDIYNEDSKSKKYRKKPIIVEAYQTDKELKASPGDYIITGVHGEKYPCKPDIFKETYEKVE